MRRPAPARIGRTAAAPRRVPRRLLSATVVAGALAVLSGCVGGDPGQGRVELAPGPASTPTTPDSGGAERSPAQASDGQCSAVAELHLSLTMLPLAEEDGVQAMSLADTADEVRGAAQDAPAAVRDDFDDAAGLLEGYGTALEPQELDELRTRLEPVDVWMGRHCSS